VVKFRVAKGAKAAILGAKAPSDARPTGKQAPQPAARTRGKAAGSPPASTNVKASTGRTPAKVAGRTRGMT
jgi:hypothetical protein